MIANKSLILNRSIRVGILGNYVPKHRDESKGTKLCL